MDLRTAVLTVDRDVRDGVYQHPTLRQSMTYAREEIDPPTFALVRTDSERDGTDTYAAYVLVRDADELDLWPLVDQLAAELDL